MSIYDVFGGGNRPFDKEEWAAAKQAQRKEAYELIDNTCSEMMASFFPSSEPNIARSFSLLFLLLS